MAVYPFYVEVDSSTRKERTGIGCRRKDGYLETAIYQRDQGAITTPYKVVQRAFEEDGKLTLITEIYYLGKCIHSHTTDY